MKFRYRAGDTPLEGYTIRKTIGHGGFGEVYHAVSDGGKEVALKLVQRYLEVELRGVRQCLNVKHHNLLTIFDVRETDDGESWIVMEYVEGANLADVLAQHPKGLPVQECLRWLIGIIDGVDHLHRCAVVHRDLKPSNIFDDRGVVKIGDYSLSKFITASRHSGQTQTIGTVHYMAPEIGSGRYGREVDIYAVGVLLYEMLTGDVPFDGATPTEVLMKHLTAAPDLNRAPAAFRPVLARMLAKNPDERYSSLQAVMADIHARLESHGKEVAAPPDPIAAGSWNHPKPMHVTASYPGTPIREPTRLSVIVRERPFLSTLALFFVMIALGVPVVFFSQPALNPMGHFDESRAIVHVFVWLGFTFAACAAFALCAVVWRSAYPSPRVTQPKRRSLLSRCVIGLSVSLRESPLLWSICLTLTSMLASPIGGDLLVTFQWVVPPHGSPMLAWSALSICAGGCIFAWLYLWRTACAPPSVRQARELDRLRLDAALRETRVDTPPVAESRNAPDPPLVEAVEPRETVGKQIVRFLQNMRRSRDDYWIGGLCGGLGKHTPIPSWVWRVGAILLAIAGGSGAIVYFALIICIPEEQDEVDTPIDKPAKVPMRAS